MEEYEILNSPSKVPHRKYFDTAVNEKTRGPSLKQIKRRFRPPSDKSSALIDNNTVSARSLKSFMNRLDKIRVSIPCVCSDCDERRFLGVDCLCVARDHLSDVIQRGFRAVRQHHGIPVPTSTCYAVHCPSHM